MQHGELHFNKKRTQLLNQNSDIDCMTDKIQSISLYNNEDRFELPQRDPLNNKLDQLSKPFIDDFVSFSDRFDPQSEESSLVDKMLSKIELFGGIGRIGNAIEQDEQNDNFSYRNSQKEIARYTSTQVAGLALGGLGLLAFGITLGPVGIAAGVGGYLLGSKLGGQAFDYVFGNNQMN
jgi:hypothetical protein